MRAAEEFELFRRTEQQPREFALRKAILQCRSYTHSPVPCGSTSPNSTIRTDIVPLVAHNVRPKIHSPRTAFTRARSSTPPSTDRAP